MTLTIFSSYVAGLSHADPDLAILSAEDTVTLIREPHNPYDPKAILVHHVAAGKLGYIPKESTLAFHEAWTMGLTITARIIGIQDQTKFKKVQIQATVEV